MSSDSLVIICNSGDNSLGIATLDDTSGKLNNIEFTPFPDVTGPGGACPLTVSPDRNTLYLAFRGTPPRVLSFAIDYRRKSLNYLGQSALPDSMVHVSTDVTGRTLFSSSYGGGILALNEIGTDGVARETKQICAAGPKAHCTLVTPDNRFVLVPSIDDETIFRYRFDVKTGLVSRTETPAAILPAGTGPRHLCFHPGGKFAYLVNEYGGTVSTFRIGEDAIFYPLQIVDITANEFTGTPSASDIHLTPDATFLYAAERASNIIAGYRVDAHTGRLEEITKINVAETPRGFNIDPTGHWLLALAQDANTIAIYSIDPQSGLLHKRQECATGDGPNWVEILPMPTSNYR